ncbi:MAG: hypothetical protein KKA19_10000, partial [Candidatus Margulisbacteria bacterium]|nr:hypothetical protein [Candidatus Margulisiibacteriota bacterium]
VDKYNQLSENEKINTGLEETIAGRKYLIKQDKTTGKIVIYLEGRREFSCDKLEKKEAFLKSELKALSFHEEDIKEIVGDLARTGVASDKSRDKTYTVFGSPGYYEIRINGTAVKKEKTLDGVRKELAKAGFKEAESKEMLEGLDRAAKMFTPGREDDLVANMLTSTRNKGKDVVQATNDYIEQKTEQGFKDVVGDLAPKGWKKEIQEEIDELKWPPEAEKPKEQPLIVYEPPKEKEKPPIEEKKAPPVITEKPKPVAKVPQEPKEKKIEEKKKEPEIKPPEPPKTEKVPARPIIKIQPEFEVESKRPFPRKLTTESRPEGYYKDNQLPGLGARLPMFQDEVEFFNYCKELGIEWDNGQIKNLGRATYTEVRKLKEIALKHVESLAWDINHDYIPSYETDKESFKDKLKESMDKKLAVVNICSKFLDGKSARKITKDEFLEENPATKKRMEEAREMERYNRYIGKGEYKREAAMDELREYYDKDLSPQESENAYVRFQEYIVNHFKFVCLNPERGSASKPSLYDINKNFIRNVVKKVKFNDAQVNGLLTLLNDKQLNLNYFTKEVVIIQLAYKYPKLVLSYLKDNEPLLNDIKKNNLNLLKKLPDHFIKNGATEAEVAFLRTSKE